MGEGPESDLPSPPAGRVRLLQVDRVVPCPIQPRANVSVHLVRQLADSMRGGRHDPVLEVEPLPDGDGRYQIICGEQRWRAAREAGKADVLALVRPPLTYLDRLIKQSEENRLRAALDPVEEAHCILLAKTLHDIRAAEQLLDEHGIDYQPLESKRIRDRAEFGQHLEQLQAQLLEHGIHVLETREGDRRCRPLSAWRETERALGISEAARKQKVGILRLPADALEEARQLPAEHAIQISRLEDASQQAELVSHASGLTHREVRDAVVRLRADPELGVEEALEMASDRAAGVAPTVAFEQQLEELADLCRQLVRRVRLLPELEPEQEARVRSLLAGLGESLGMGSG